MPKFRKNHGFESDQFQRRGCKGWNEHAYAWPQAFLPFFIPEKTTTSLPLETYCPSIFPGAVRPGQ